MRKKTIWTVVAGTSAAVLVPGVAYALVAGGASMPTEGPGVGNGGADASIEDPSLASPALEADLEPASEGPGPTQVPATESLKSAGVCAVADLRPVGRDRDLCDLRPDAGPRAGPAIDHAEGAGGPEVLDEELDEDLDHEEDRTGAQEERAVGAVTGLRAVPGHPAVAGQPRLTAIPGLRGLISRGPAVCPSARSRRTPRRASCR